MNQFASGQKRSYYGKGDVIVYRLNRETGSLFGANVLLLIYGDAFWPTYTTGDNTGLVATDSMKNFIQRETLNFAGADLESYAKFLAEKFLNTYPQAEGAQLTASEIPYVGQPSGCPVLTPAGPERAQARLELTRQGPEIPYSHGAQTSVCAPVFTPGGPDRAQARLELTRNGPVEIRSGIQGFKLLRLGGSAFYGFVRDQYTTLPEIKNRPLHMWLDLDWSYTSPEAAFTKGAVTAQVRKTVLEVFAAFESGSIQQIIYQIGAKVLQDILVIEEIHLEANNRTWDTIIEQGESMGIYTDARPPYGCLGLTLRR